jgi:hypothetical protein
MTLLARRARPVYRVYTEVDYLQAGADPFADWPATVAEPAAGVAGQRSMVGEPAVGLGVPQGRMGRVRVSRERRLRRLAGAAALTGAVGTVGGLLGSALVSGRSTGRRAASATGRLEASARAAAGVAAELPSRDVRAALTRARGGAVAGRVGAGRAGSARARARRVAIADSPGRGRSGEVGRVAAALRDGRMRGATNAAPVRAGMPVVVIRPAASTASAAQVQAAGAAQSAQAQPAQAAGARGEFGFEH